MLNRQANERMLQAVDDDHTDLMNVTAPSGSHLSKNYSKQRSVKYHPHIFKDTDGSLVNPLHAKAMELAMKRHEDAQARLVVMRQQERIDHQEKLAATLDDLKGEAEKKEFN